jgi:hypothetical protein
VLLMAPVKKKKTNNARKTVQSKAAVLHLEDGPSSGLRLKVVAAFLAVLAFHFLWTAFFGGDSAHCVVQAGMEDDCGPLERYLETGGYWMGLSYAASLAFATFAWLKFRMNRSRHNENAALGGIGLAGGLAVLGCFFVGCCGSPMLPVFLGVVGAQFLPQARPLILLITLLSVAYGVHALKRRENECFNCDCKI